MCKHDLDAALKVLVDEAPGHCTPNDVIWLSHAFRAYHGEPEHLLSRSAEYIRRSQEAQEQTANSTLRFGPPCPQAEPKIEAGAVVELVSDSAHTPMTVAAFDGDWFWCTDAFGGLFSRRREDIRPVTPATPEPDDYVQHRDGRTGIMVRTWAPPLSRLPYELYLAKEHQYAERSDFTILMKAPK